MRCYQTIKCLKTNLTFKMHFNDVFNDSTYPRLQYLIILNKHVNHFHEIEAMMYLGYMSVFGYFTSLSYDRIFFIPKTKGFFPSAHAGACCYSY